MVPDLIPLDDGLKPGAVSRVSSFLLQNVLHPSDLSQLTEERTRTAADLLLVIKNIFPQTAFSVFLYYLLLVFIFKILS